MASPFPRSSAMGSAPPRPAFYLPNSMALSFSPGSKSRARFARTFAGLAVTCILLFLTTDTAQSQARGDTLPDLSPREVEIRGALSVSFPSVARLPLAGFAPPSRVRGVGEDRRPTRPTYRQPLLPPSPLGRPDAPQTALLDLPNARRGGVEGGAGSLLTRFGSLTTGLRLAPAAQVFVEAAYEGTDGHTPNPFLPTADADAATARVGVEGSGARGSYRTGVDGFFHSFRLFGAEPGTPPFNPAFNPQEAPRRLGIRGGAFASGSLHPAPAWALSANVRFDQTRYDTGLYGPISEDDDRTLDREARLSGGFSAAYAWEDWQVRALVDGAIAGIGTDVTQADLGYASTGLDATFATDYLRLTLGPRFMATHAEGGFNSINFEGSDAVTAFADLSVRASPTLEFYARNTPHVETGALDAVMTRTPYLLPRQDRRASLVPIDAQGGARITLGAFQIGGWGGYATTKDQAVIVETDAVFSTGGLVLEYGDVVRPSAGGDVKVVVLSDLTVGLGGLWQQARLTDRGDARVPHVADAQGYAVATYRLPGARGSVRAEGVWHGPRDASVGGRSLDSYVDFNVSATYRVTPYLGLVLHLDHLAPASTRERWAGYREAPATVRGGVQILW